MIHKAHAFSSIALATLMLSAGTAYAGDQYEVTVTNLTRAQSFTPILVASHKRGVHLFEQGSAASSELSTLAEGGDIAPLNAQLLLNKKVSDTSHSEGLLAPGATTTIKVSAKSANHISLAAMLIPTNDAFFALNGVKVTGKSRVFYSPAYDAGSENNDEMCVNIPGPVCGGEGVSENSTGEGYVHIHGGIHGIADLAAETYDWRNPVARISVRKVD